MVLSRTIRLISLLSLLAMPATTAVLWTSSSHAQIAIPDEEVMPGSEEPLDGTEDPLAIPEDPADLRPLMQDGSILSIPGGQRLMTEAGDAIAVGDYDLAVEKLQQARQLFNQLSNFYQELHASFSGIDPRIADVQRQQALETAQLRDQATYQLALVHRAQNQPELAVPLLIQIIRSQQPTRPLGQDAYRQLFELGFVDSPYPRTSEADEPTSVLP
jgi:hypothetical protein